MDYIRKNIYFAVTASSLTLASRISQEKREDSIIHYTSIQYYAKASVFKSSPNYES